MDQLPFCIFFKLKGVFHLSLLLCVCDVFVCECWCTCGNQRTMFLTPWFLGIELDPSVFCVSTFTCWAILLVIYPLFGCKLELVFIVIWGGRVMLLLLTSNLLCREDDLELWILPNAGIAVCILWLSPVVKVLGIEPRAFWRDTNILPTELYSPPLAWP